MEITFLLLWQMRQKIDFQKSRTLAQCLLSQKEADSETIKKVFDDLKEAFFPFEKNAKAAEMDKWRQKLFAEVNRGALAISVQEDPSAQPKMRSRLERGRQDLAKKLSMEQSGRSVGMDPFRKAERRPRGAF